MVCKRKLYLAVLFALVGSAIAGSGRKSHKSYGKRSREPIEEAPAKSAFDLGSMQTELKKLAQMISNAANPPVEEEPLDCKLRLIQYYSNLFHEFLMQYL